MVTTADKHGLRNYAESYSVNRAEATQIVANGERILRFMIHGPDAKPHQFAESVRKIAKEHRHESVRGLPEALFYGKETRRPITPVYEFMKEEGVSDSKLRKSIEFLFHSLSLRQPTESEVEKYFQLTKSAIKSIGKEEGAILGLSSIFVDRNALFRPELAADQNTDQFGRAMLQGEELRLAINAAFCYINPDDHLEKQLQAGKLKSKEDVRREVLRYLETDSIRKPRVLQFFREYFDYDRAGKICKDDKALIQGGGDESQYYRTMNKMVASTDRLVERILRKDKDVLKELLTTREVVLDRRSDTRYYSQLEAVKEAYQRNLNQAKKNGNKKARRNLRKKVNSRLFQDKSLAQFQSQKQVHIRLSPHALKLKPKSTQRILSKLPSDQRMGILTQPSWLVSHSDAMDNHAILRGKWIRERLLGDAVPDVPITVDAMLPDEPKMTLRHRMRVTREQECWRCHQKMDPLGLPFERYNHLGLIRDTEKGKPVNTTGEILFSGDNKLDGTVKGPLEMIQKLANSKRVEQVFVRHAFRFWMGRNETLEDAPILQKAHRDYVESGGSMKALLVSLLTSDAFLYRKVDSTK